MQLRLVLPVLIALLPARFSSAQQPPVYDLRACVEAALAASPDLAATVADIAASRAQLAQARAGRFGQMEYTQILGVVNEAEGDPVFSPDDEDDFFDNPGPFTRLDLDINIPLWTFGKLEAALEAAEQGLASEQANGALRRAHVILATKRLYYGLLLARQLSAVLHDMLERMTEAVERTEERLEEGSTSVTELDLLKLRIGRARFAKGVYEIDASLALTHSALARAMGLPLDAPFELAARRLRPVQAEIAPVEEYLTDGVAGRPEWQRLRSGLAAQSAKVQLERADYYPIFFFSTGVQFAYAPNREDQENPFAYDEFNFLRPVAVVGLRWDLNFPRTKARVDQARAELERLQAQEREAATGLLLEIRRAHGAVLQAQRTMEAAEAGRKAGRGLLVLSVANFDLGIGEAEDLFEGLGAYTEASTDYFRAVHDYNVAVAELGRAVGRELEGPEQR